MVGNKIKIIREIKNYTQEYMASELNISQNAYSRIELNKTKLTTALAEKIADILEVSLADLLSKDNPIITFSNNTIDKNFGYINNHYESQKELYENTITLLQKELTDAKEREERLLKLLEKRGYKS
ncbi:MAG TPA: helix-turn-helix transcriptional regulator [Chitinophagaceae bacterium]|nr:helix-turn-helix transcriptional regulator [Chitinophagaceae bacterium]HNL83198.1 helix-turn-helix transcriptional regulator [Chitinophagaceae bacterium]HNM34616.1 helix-turn-helix transcriptional regulator [Chitinophagaceae bacterium]